MAQQQIASAQNAFDASEPAKPALVRAKPRRLPVRRLILSAVVVCAVVYAGSKAYDWFTVGRFLVSTDDAYVGASMAVISAKIAGHVTEVAVKNNAVVRKGDLLARIDDGDYQLAVKAAEGKVATQGATIARAAKQVEAQGALIAQADAQRQTAQAQLASAKADEQRAALEFDRSQKLAQTSFGSQQRLEQASADKSKSAAAIASAAAAAAGAEAGYQAAKANLDVLAAEKAEVEHVRAELATALEVAKRNLTFTDIRAPFDGVVGNKAVEVGQYAQTGVRLMALVSQTTVYVDANFKETQLAAIHPGQRVDVAVDALDGRIIVGEVQSMSGASGAQFSLLPPDNATGNFTKVVQRVAVRIALPAEALKDGALRPGLSVVASVHTRDDALPKPTLLGALGLGGAGANP